MQSDPIGFDAGDTNLFRYGGNDPVNNTDPMGLLSTNQMWDFACFGDSGNSFQGNWNEFMNRDRVAEVGGAQDGTTQFHDSVRNYVKRYHPDAGKVSSAQIGSVLVEDAREAAEKTVTIKDSKGWYGIEQAAARYLVGGRLVKVGPVTGEKYRYEPHAFLPRDKRIPDSANALTGSHSHGVQSGRKLSGGDFFSADGNNDRRAPFIISVGASADQGRVIHIYVPNGGAFYSVDGRSFFLERRY